MIDPTTSAQSAGPASTSSSLSQLSADYETFLKLLTAQVSNQDPLAPMDSSTFVTQLAQLSQVEQSVQVNDNLAEISNKIAGAIAMSDVQLIGRTVAVPGQQITTSQENTRMSYQLSGPASEVSANIVAVDGTVLRRFEGLPTSSDETHDFVWDGRDMEGLPVVGEGPFRLEINASDSEGTAVSYTSFTEARVASVIFRDGASMLVLEDGAEVASSRVARVE